MEANVCTRFRSKKGLDASDASTTPSSVDVILITPKGEEQENDDNDDDDDDDDQIEVFLEKHGSDNFQDAQTANLVPVGSVVVSFRYYTGELLQLLVKKDLNFRTILKAYAKYSNLNAQTLRFVLNENRILADETPQSLKIRTEDYIKVTHVSYDLCDGKELEEIVVIAIASPLATYMDTSRLLQVFRIEFSCVYIH